MKIRWCRPFGKEPPTASARPAGRSCSARSTSSRQSPSARASRSGCWSLTISFSNPTAPEEAAMAKLKLGALADDKPVKLTVELPAAIHRDLVAYGQALARETGESAVEPAKLVGPMLARFMATDRAFAKFRRSLSAPEKVL